MNIYGSLWISQLRNLLAMVIMMMISRWLLIDVLQRRLLLNR
jgi:hypothetical protein